ncbi:MAG: hypothetical protein ABIE55_03255 [Candidatus Aenigmatarchaeota archaeon]
MGKLKGGLKILANILIGLGIIGSISSFMTPQSSSNEIAAIEQILFGIYLFMLGIGILLSLALSNKDWFYK